MEMTWEDYLANTQSLESKKPENEYRSSICEIRARYDHLVQKHDQQPKDLRSILKDGLTSHPQTTVPRLEDGNIIEPEPGTENEDAADQREIEKPQLYTHKHDFERAYITNLGPQGVSAADIETAKISAQTIINNESLMKGDMINEGHEKTAFDAAIQSKQFLNDMPQHETGSAELAHIQKEYGKDVKIIEGKANKYYGPGTLKLYEKTAVLSLSRNLKVAYNINDLKGQMPEAQEKAIPVCGMKLLTDENGGRKIDITHIKEKATEHER